MPNTSADVNDSEEVANLPDVLQFMQLLWAVVHGLERLSKQMAGDIGVTSPQRLVLRVVGLFLLQRLVGQRLLARSDDPSDRRRAVLRLTKRGGRVNAAREGTVEAAIALALGGVSDRDRMATKRVLGQLAAHLEPPGHETTAASVG